MFQLFLFSFSRFFLLLLFLHLFFSCFLLLFFFFFFFFFFLLVLLFFIFFSSLFFFFFFLFLLLLLTLIYLDLFFFFYLFVFVTACAWNHCKTSGFRHMSKNHPNVCAWNHYKNSVFRDSTEKTCLGARNPKSGIFVAGLRCWCARNHCFYSGSSRTSNNHPSACASNHYKNSGFRHSTKKQDWVREAQKVGFLSENLALCRSTHTPLANVSFFLRLRVRSRNPYFCSVFGTSQRDIVEKCTFLKTSKNQGQKKSALSTYLP